MSTKMDGFLIATLFAFTVAPVFALPVNGTDPNAWTAFKPQPHGRGTIGIFLSCVVTFGLCTWTSVHPNILPPGTSHGARIKYKLVWMAIAAIFPQGVMLCAFSQWRRARSLHELWLKKFPVTPREQQDTMGMEGAFFVLMGGFTLPEEGGFEPILTAKGFEKYLDEWKISRSCFDKRAIADKGKASYVAKLLAFIQASWLIFQCISRLIVHLPITLLEIHVAIQVVCTLFSYFFWWSKPLDVNEPLTISLLSVEAAEAEKLKSEEAAKKSKEDAKNLKSKDDSNLRKGFWHRGTRSNQAGAPAAVGGNDQGANRSTPVTITVEGKGQGVNGSTPALEVVEDSGQEASGSTPGLDNADRIEPVPTTTERESPQTAAGNGNEPIKNPSPALETYNFSRSHLEILEKPRTGFLHALLRGIYDLAEAIVGRDERKILVVGFFLSLNGGLHLVAWNSYFNSRAEDLLWKISCLAICLSALIYTALIAISNLGVGQHKKTIEMRFLEAVWETRFYDHEVGTHIMDRIKAEAKGVPWYLRPLVYFIWVMAAVYVICVIYITLEAFISLRILPDEYYRTPVWDSYWPHVG